MHDIQPQFMAAHASPGNGLVFGYRSWKVFGSALAIAVLAAPGCGGARPKTPEPVSHGPDTAAPDNTTLPAVSPVQVEAGFSRLTLDGDVQVLIHAPAVYAILTGSKIQLFLGTLTAIVPSSGKEFTVVTNEASITGVADEFGVIAGDHYTRTQAFDGRVSVESNAAHPSRRALAIGQANRVISGGQIETEQANPGLFVRVGDYDVKKGITKKRE